MDLFRAYTQEAKWYSTGYTPKLEEYMKNAWISILALATLSNAFFLIKNPIEKEVVDSLYKYHNIVKCAAMVLRLANDLGESTYEMERGDVAKSVECFMNESCGTREEARECVKGMTWETWKEMNAERVADSGFSQDFMRIAVDLGRIAYKSSCTETLDNLILLEDCLHPSLRVILVANDHNALAQNAEIDRRRTSLGDTRQQRVLPLRLTSPFRIRLIECSDMQKIWNQVTNECQNSDMILRLRHTINNDT
ncbi:hypothetical protein ACS0TY_012723 [Phlomoides rotata]